MYSYEICLKTDIYGVLSDTGFTKSAVYNEMVDAKFWLT